jgi:hypothetical protein
MTDFGRRPDEMLKNVYDPDDDGVIAVAQTEADMKKEVYDQNDDGYADDAEKLGGETLSEVKGAIELNIFLNAFRIAANGSLARFNMVDGAMDEFEDESGIDAGNSAGQSYNPTYDYYSNSAVIWSDVLNTSAGGLINQTLRQVIPAASISKSGDFIRATMESGPTSEGLEIDNVSIVERDPGTSNGVTIPTELLFGETSGVFITVGTSEVSDWLEYPIDETKDYLLIMDIGVNDGDDNGRYVTTGGGGLYSKLNTNSYNVQNLADPTWTASNTWIVNKIEIKENMVLQSNATEAEATPDSARLILMEEDVDATAENTDLKAYASRDNGANWVQATLVDEGDYGSGKRILTGSADISGQAEDKTMKWKITTHNLKTLKLHGVGKLWS